MSGSSEEKIRLLETLDMERDPQTIGEIISRLDDEDIKVRGEAFSSLILNKNKISDFLVDGLHSTSKNIRGFVLLVLANRNDTSAIPEIIKLADDERSMVRSCAIGALEYLGATGARQVFARSVFDPSLEVRKSALQALVKLRITIPAHDIQRIETEGDPELEDLLLELKRHGGPEGI